MESSQTIQDFVLSFQQLSKPRGVEWGKGFLWMENFVQSENALTTCGEIVKSSLDDSFKLHAVSIVRRKVDNAFSFNDETSLVEIYHFLLDMIKTKPSVQICREICNVIAVLFTRKTFWKISFRQLIDDIHASLTKSADGINDLHDDLYSKKIAILFTRALFTELYEMNEPDLDLMKSKIFPEFKIMSDLVSSVKEDTFLEDIICAYMIQTRIFRPADIHECKIFVAIWDILRDVGPEKTDLMKTCKICIPEIIEWVKLPDGNETEKQYQFFTSLVKNLRPAVESRIPKGDNYWGILITRIVIKLANKFFDFYVNSDNVDDFSFCEELAHIGEFNNIYVYDEIAKFWIEFERYVKLCYKPKLKMFFDKYFEIFVIQTIKILPLCEKLIDEEQKGGKDCFVYDVRYNMRECLRTVFQVIPFQPHFNNAISIIRQNPGYFSRIESQLFFITGMITETSVLSDFHEVLEIILNFPHDAPSFFIETCCDVLRDFIYHSYGRKNSDDKPTVDYDSIYRWLACVPEEAIVNLGFDVDFDCMEIDQVIKGFEFINNIIAVSTEISQAEHFGDVMEKALSNCLNADADEVIEIYECLLNFYSKTLLRDNATQSDYSRLALFLMTSFAKVLKNDLELAEIFDDSDDFSQIIMKITQLCFEVINRLNDNENVCVKICDVLFIIVSKYGSFHPNLDKLAQQLLQVYKKFGFSCFITPFVALAKACGEEVSHSKKLFKNFRIVFDHTCDFLSLEDSNNRSHHVELLMKLLRLLLEDEYDKVLDQMDVGRLADLASHGLLSQKQKTFKECYKVLIEFFTNASSTNRQKKQETKSIVVRLYDSQVHQIVKNCIEVILTSTNLWNVRECGNMLRIMNNANRSGIESKIKIDTKLIKEMLQKYMNEIRSDESVCDDMEDILSAPSKEKAEEMAKKINFKFCKS